MKEGRCDLEHPGVNAPGTPKIATFLPAQISDRFTSTGPAAPATSSLILTAGSLSPTLTVMVEVSPATDEAALVVRNVLPLALGTNSANISGGDMAVLQAFDTRACAKRVPELLARFPTVDCSASFSARRPASSGVSIDRARSIRTLVLRASTVNRLPRQRIELVERAFIVDCYPPLQQTTVVSIRT
jgi:hypothetical protein